MRQVCEAINRRLGVKTGTVAMSLDEASREWGEGTAQHTMGSNSRRSRGPCQSRAWLAPEPAVADRGNRKRLLRRMLCWAMTDLKLAASQTDR